MIKKIKSNELLKGGIVLFVMFNIFNFLNFVFHFSMGRLLGPEDYGILAVLMSIIYIYSVPIETIQTVVSRYASKFNIKKEKEKIRFMMVKALKKGVKISFKIFIIMVFVSIFLSKFLEINFFLIFLTNLLVFSSFSVPVLRGVLQGRKKFFSFGSSMVIESFLKLFFAISLVIIGWKVFGAVIGVLLGTFSGIVSALYFNKEIIDSKEKEASFDGIYLKSIPYLITMLVILLIFSLDIILAKNFFSAEIAGQYAALSMIGKIIFFATLSISKTMFPLTSEKYDKKEDSSKLFRKSLLIVSFLCFTAVFFYWIMPELIIFIFYGPQYLEMTPYLVYSGLALSFLALSNLNLVYALSTNKLKNSGWLFVFLIIEIILLWIFHSNILEYIIAFMVSNIIMFIGSFFFMNK